MRLAVCWQHLTLFNVSQSCLGPKLLHVQVCGGAVPGAARPCGGREVTVGDVSKALKEIKCIGSQVMRWKFCGKAIFHYVPCVLMTVQERRCAFDFSRVGRSGVKTKPVCVTALCRGNSVLTWQSDWLANDSLWLLTGFSMTKPSSSWC